MKHSASHTNASTTSSSQMEKQRGLAGRPASNGAPTQRATGAADAAAVRPAARVQAPADGPQGSSTTTKKEIIDRIAADTRQKRSAVKRTVQAFLDTVIDELSVGNRLELRDFGVFEIKERAARTAQNPKTLERVKVPARKTVKFKVGRLMKESVEELERESQGRGAAGSGRESDAARPGKTSGGASRSGAVRTAGD